MKGKIPYQYIHTCMYALKNQNYPTQFDSCVCGTSLLFMFQYDFTEIRVHCVFGVFENNGNIFA